MAKFTKKAARELAEDYGYAYSFLRSDKSLWNLFKRAVQKNWDQATFTAKLRSTPWYKKHSEAARSYLFLKKNDPATFRARTAATKAQIGDLAAQIGATMSSGTLGRVTAHALMFGWNDSQIRNTLASYVKIKDGLFKGQAADDFESIKQKAYRNGVKISSNTAQNWVKQIAAGATSMNSVEASIRKMAKGLAPNFDEELEAGIDLYDAMQPYMQRQAELLEIGPADVDLFDPHIRRAMTAKDKNGKPTAKTLWQFEQDIRRDPRWFKTKNAQDEIIGTGRSILQQFGFRS